MSMAMSGCSKCYDTPCTCGHEWRGKDKGSIKSVLTDLYEYGMSDEEANEFIESHNLGKEY